ncbi:LacI family DNA-binding transcriptional regulator [Vibrio sp. AK197]
MRKKKVTMLDIATAVGVSQPTVSIILNGSDSVKISQETRDKVINKAKELGYKMRAHIYHAQSHRRIALLVNSMNMHDPFINALSAAKVRAWELDAILTVFDYEDNEELKTCMLETILNGNFDGLIYALNTPTEIDDALPTSLPVLMLNCTHTAKTSTIPSVVTSDFLGGYHAAQHLIDSGYQRIAMITGESWADSSVQRLRGFRQAMTNADLPINEAWIKPGNWSVKQSYLETQTLLNARVRPDAIFCASDLMALGAYQAITHANLTIPEDIAVIGYDNQLLASQLTPSLSSVDLPYDEMGRVAVETLLSPTSPELLLMKIEGELVCREST